MDPNNNASLPSHDRLIYLLKKNLSRQKKDKLSDSELAELAAVRAKVSDDQWFLLNERAKDSREREKTLSKKQRDEIVEWERRAAEVGWQRVQNQPGALGDDEALDSLDFDSSDMRPESAALQSSASASKNHQFMPSSSGSSHSSSSQQQSFQHRALSSLSSGEPEMLGSPPPVMPSPLYQNVPVIPRDQHEREILMLKKAHREAVADLQYALHNSQSSLRSLQTRCAQLEEENANLEKDTSRLQGLVKSLVDSQSAVSFGHSTAPERHGQDHQNAKEDGETNGHSVAEYQTQIAALQERIELAKRDAARLEAAAKQKEDGYQSMERLLAEEKRERAGAMAWSMDLERQVAELKKVIAETEEEKQKLHLQLQVPEKRSVREREREADAERERERSQWASVRQKLERDNDGFRQRLHRASSGCAQIRRYASELRKDNVTLRAHATIVCDQFNEYLGRVSADLLEGVFSFVRFREEHLIAQIKKSQGDTASPKGVNRHDRAGDRSASDDNELTLQSLSVSPVRRDSALTSSASQAQQLPPYPVSVKVFLNLSSTSSMVSVSDDRTQLLVAPPAKSSYGLDRIFLPDSTNSDVTKHVFKDSTAGTVVYFLLDHLLSEEISIGSKSRGPGVLSRWVADAFKKSLNAPSQLTAQFAVVESHGPLADPCSLSTPVSATSSKHALEVHWADWPAHSIHSIVDFERLVTRLSTYFSTVKKPATAWFIATVEGVVEGQHKRIVVVQAPSSSFPSISSVFSATEKKTMTSVLECLSAVHSQMRHIPWRHSRVTASVLSLVGKSLADFAVFVGMDANRQDDVKEALQRIARVKTQQVTLQPASQPSSSSSVNLSTAMDRNHGGQPGSRRPLSAAPSSASTSRKIPMYSVDLSTSLRDHNL
eukprot:ANDGO_01989.mRNA.1 hypothetical protein